jgi:hypothetical protein
MGKEPAAGGAFGAAVAAGPQRAASPASGGALAPRCHWLRVASGRRVQAGDGAKHANLTPGAVQRPASPPGLCYREGQANRCPQAVQDGAPRSTGEWPQRWQA